MSGDETEVCHNIYYYIANSSHYQDTSDIPDRSEGLDKNAVNSNSIKPSISKRSDGGFEIDVDTNLLDGKERMGPRHVL